MKEKILFVASVSLHFKAFHIPYLKWFKEQGYEVHTVANNEGLLPYVDKEWVVPIERSPFMIKNIKAYRGLKEIIKKENYTLINCHTPVASFLTRAASINARKNGLKVIYTAHGFHFFKNAPLFNWVIYYPLEIILSYFTDSIVCINNKDLVRIKNRGSKKCEYYLIPGIGVEKKKFFKVAQATKNALREKNNIPLNKFVLIYCAEFIKRKNHRFLINAIEKHRDKMQGVLVLLAGNGMFENRLKNLVKKRKLEKHIKFLGFRNDIDEVYKMSDLGISTSKQEGLGLNLIEEMMCGLPVVATMDRGHKEIVDHNINGMLYDQGDHEAFIKAILLLKKYPDKYKRFSENAIVKAEKFELKNSLKKMASIYQEHLA